ncbi:MAG: ABC transporter ATP-binding protein [Kiritimatiellae bacterium]|nr:ABC transporter ATP-binding protein [Kiritimatiellia bacterium]
MNEALITRGLVKKYGRHAALDGFSLSVPRGSVTGLVGANGAGKTTWMMTVAGFVRPNSGEVNLLGRGAFDAAVHSGRVTILPQDSDLPNEGRVRSLLVGYGRLQGLSGKAAGESADRLIEAFNLSGKANSSIRTLSHGMRKRVAVAQTFLGEPELVMLDEPLSGLDPVEADRLRTFILSRRGKTTIVVSSHQLDDIERLCSHVAFVAAGKVERMETLRALTSDTGRIAYALRMKPDRLSDVAAACPGVRLSEEADGIVAEFSSELSVEAVNAALLPRLIEFGVLSVQPGRSLADAYLDDFAK